MKTVIHVNQAVVKANSKNGVTDPVLTCKTYKENIYAHEVIIYGQDGKEAARIIYRPEKALSCGAKVWIETSNRVETILKKEEIKEDPEKDALEEFLLHYEFTKIKEKALEEAFRTGRY